MTATNRQQINSASIAAIAYTEDAAVLEIQFRSGTVYRYQGVPDVEYRALLAADSKGRHFVHRIRGRYAYQLLTAGK